MIRRTLFPGPADSARPRPWWARLIHDLAWVTFITLLIWVYADMEFTDTMELRATVVLSVGPSKNLILKSEPEYQVTFTVQGNRQSIERLQQKLAENGGLVGFNLSSQARGESFLDVPSMLEREANLDALGLTVVSSSPRFIPVTLDRRATFEIAVQPEFINGAPAEDTPVQVSPEKVQIRIAQSDWMRVLRAVPEGQPPVLKTQPIDLRNYSKGEMFDSEVPVSTRLLGVQVTPEPRRVQVTCKVDKRLIEKTITVSVRVQVSYDLLQDDSMAKLVLQRNERYEWTKREIKVTGPQEDIQQVTGDNVDAYVEIVRDHLRPVDSWLPARVKVKFPAGLDVELVGDAPEVEFKFVPRP